ncbi:hypothetical protein GYM62_13880 [Algoriphagus sp. NBT04N3]|uniref:hypothetical protein n=1 Tax=Algoriphagus sp. NBT04N3 TaxID=2705473 RepID=UPI001C62C357|nr:hypothetical protein [Algoriphagus sp. NBT04N3]QYH39817.1 hypothetical protein GYM62_13880 [Algoriphagus sp. NBT04N3]
MKRSVLKIGILAFGFFGSFFVFGNSAEAQTMTCSLKSDSITYYPDGMVCAFYDCPNGEQVQACNMPLAEVGG